MKSSTITLLVFGIVNLSLFSAKGQALDPTKKSLKASRTLSSINIDGVLDEEDWINADIATGFKTLDPNPGLDPSFKTEVKVIYDNTALYIGAIMYDTNPDSVLKELSQRDQLGNTDWFGLFLDPYRDGINGFGFILTPASVQFDAKYSVFGEDENWDAVWEGEASINSQAWVAEIKIPYSAIRFPKAQEQNWHINFGRQLQRKQEKVFWSEIDPQENGFLNQSGYLKEVKDVVSPIRLQATPFIAVYGEHYKDKNAEQTNSYGHSFNGGMDIKYGINDAFTLDMTLIPDFGEAQSDNQVLNLSPFEVRFDENRQFFTEGTELFNKGNLFYSRRIGGRPVNASKAYANLDDGEQVIDNPITTQLINASKVSGRTKGGLGLGVFNAVSARTFATIENALGDRREVETSPLTNYNVFVMDQNLKHNSFITLINTNVWRSGSTYDANSTGTVFTLRNKANSYAIEGSAKLSQKYFTNDTELGHAYNIGLNKTSGNIQFGINYNEESDTYDINDLGFIFNNNERSVNMFVRYNQFKPFLFFNSGGFGFWNGYQRLYNPNKFSSYSMEFWFFGQTKGFWNVNIWSNINPIITYDYFEAREAGRFYRLPTNRNVGFWVGSDSRKKLRVSVNANFRNFGEEGRRSVNFNINPRFRFNDKLSMSMSTFMNVGQNDVGYVNKIISYEQGPSGDIPQSNDIIFGTRDLTTVENVFNTAYNFNNNMALTFRMRHYWTKVEYNRFNVLNEDGNLGYIDYNNDHNTSFNAFNIDMIYRWRFAPGSDIFIIWKNAILGSNDDTDLTYFNNVGNLFDNPQSNSISMKVIYFLDYINLVKKK
ncbi:MAG: DUF5916 domain-containing protein [Bacteroidota bacterium]